MRLNELRVAPGLLYTAYRIYADLANRARDALALVAPDSARMHEMMAQHLVNEGDLSGAIAQYRKALAMDPKLRGIHYELGEAILKDSTSDTALQQAEKEFRAALAENPGDAGAECRLGRCARSAWTSSPQWSTTHARWRSALITSMPRSGWVRH